MLYYIVKNIDTGEYFRGKGVNKWGKYFNQASIYRIKANAEDTAAWENKQREANCVVVPIRIIETDNEVREVIHGKWMKEYTSGTTVSQGFVASCCDMWNERETSFCPYCGAYMA